MKLQSDKINVRKLWAKQFIMEEMFEARILCRVNSELKLFGHGNVFQQFHYLFIAQCLQPTDKEHILSIISIISTRHIFFTW